MVQGKKLAIGISLILLSFIIGFYSKIVIIAKFYNIFYVLTGLSIYAFSWLLLFLGAFLVGRETMKIAQQKINQQITKTYRYTKQIPTRGVKYTKELHKKFKERHKHKKIDIIP